MWIGESAGGAAAPRPKIGITGKDLAQLANYIEAVEAAGGEAVPLLPIAGGLPDGALDGLDGLVLSGGDDIDPAVYGQEARAELEVVVDHPRDALEIPLARKALERDVPVLGTRAVPDRLLTRLMRYQDAKPRFVLPQNSWSPK